MVSTKKPLHPLGENTKDNHIPFIHNCVYENFKLQTVLYQRTFNRSHWATC
ncbi:hypothetical protein [uncultured Gammaproteobacteria bacterium]|nr:hypothetical protein [uncultured Gammaproteobacteria bacterium]